LAPILRPWHLLAMAHGSGSRWLAMPSLCDSFIRYSAPVSRRTDCRRTSPGSPPSPDFPICVDIAAVTIKMISMYTLVFTATARRQYEALVGKIRGQVDKGLVRIASHPEHGKPLRGELHGIWSERLATFRILYKIHAHAVEVLILTIEHRKGVYGGH